MKDDIRSFSDQVFDKLSSVPYLKIALKCLWRFALVYTPSIYLLGFCLQGISFFQIPGTIKTWVLYIIGIVCFGFMFRAWDSRDIKKEKSLQ